MWTVRPYETADRDAVVALADRLLVGAASWRDPDRWVTAVRGWVAGSIESAGQPDHALFVAYGDGDVAGFVSVSTREHFTGDVDAYVGELAVAPWAEGRGAGRELVVAAERWARDNGYARITLETGAANRRARDFYYRGGYLDEEVRLTKQLP